MYNVNIHRRKNKGRLSKNIFCAPVLPGTKLGKDPFMHEAPYAVPHPFKEQVFDLICRDRKRFVVKWYGSRDGRIDIDIVNQQKDANPILWAEKIKSGVFTEDTLNVNSKIDKNFYAEILPWIN